MTRTRPNNTTRRPSFGPFFASACSFLILFSFRPITAGGSASVRPRGARTAPVLKPLFSRPLPPGTRIGAPGRPFMDDSF